MKRYVFALAGLALLVLSPGFAVADLIILNPPEDPVTGFVGDIFQGNPAAGGQQVIAASDGEAPFHPFGVTFDVSDGLQLHFAGVYTFSLLTGSNWVQLPDLPDGTQTWVLPAIDENEPGSETTGHWIVNQSVAEGGFWNPGFPGDYVILEAGGAPSDHIILANDGPDGRATITFQSDPFSNPVPEPATMTMLGIGVASLFGYRLRRKKA